MKDENSKHLYFDIPKQERDSAIAFLLDALLKSSVACSDGRVRSKGTDEDVNIYLAHLLFASSLPDYQSAIKRYLSTNVSEMAGLVEDNEDKIVRYFIYKVNADHLLVHLGVFQDLENSGGAFSKSQQQYSSMAQNYYKQAADYNQRIYRRQTAIGSVLEKLAHDFRWYRQILHYARKEFFHFSNHFRDREFVDFCETLKIYEQENKVTETRDLFLDCYLEWKRTNDSKVYEKLLRVGGELQKLDPEFTFDLNKGV